MFHQFWSIKRSSVCGLKFGGGVVFSQICSVARVQTNNGLEELLERSSSLVFKGFENWSKSFVKLAAAAGKSQMAISDPYQSAKWLKVHLAKWRLASMASFMKDALFFSTW